MMVSNSVSASNAYGITVNSNGTVRASEDIVTRNSAGGFLQLGTGVFRSRGNNTVDGNSPETSGTITPFAPI